jgi:hypothetical protein
MTVDPNLLTHDLFVEELRERVDILRGANLDVPDGLISSVEMLLTREHDPFRNATFRLAAAHLLNGLEPELLDGDEGALELEERLADLPANVRLSAELAAAQPELV